MIRPDWDEATLLILQVSQFWLQVFSGLSMFKLGVALELNKSRALNFAQNKATTETIVPHMSPNHKDMSPLWTNNPTKYLIYMRNSGEPCRIRTCDPLIKSQLLYQLS